jgi:hypothetical protein
MLNYLKNFIAKLALLPVLALLGGFFLLFFLITPYFKLFKEKTNKRGTHGRKEEVKDYEAFY